MSSEKFLVFDFSDPKTRILHYSWLAFFITFFMWFCHASLMPFIVETFGLSIAEAKALLFLNVALTIPARIFTGVLVDKFGPRLMFSLLLAISGVFCMFFAVAQTYEQLAAARFLLGFTGAGFVIGIRLVTEWFPVRQAGAAQGIYGGWGNFGAAIANFALPAMAVAFSSIITDGWRGAVAVAGIVSIAYAFVFYAKVRNTPKGSTYFSPKKMGPMEVTSYGDMVLYAIMSAPIVLAIAIICWRLSPSGVSLLSDTATYIIWAGLALWYVWQVISIYRSNVATLKEGVPELHRYKFKQVAMLDLAYMVTFGSEVAVVSMLPLMFTSEAFGYTPAKAALLAGFFMAMNLIARPGGGYLSDKIGRKKTLLMTVFLSAVGYAGMAMITPESSFAMIVAIVVFSSFFVQAGAGATFGVVPTIKRRLTGQIAGMTGAYGNVGAASFLLVNSFYEPSIFFTVISVSCVVVGVLLLIFLDEPKGQIAEILPDGTVQLIDVG
ncbi:MAG: MFS transporter [Pseudomonadales bacterium]|nr:MFS transporter [Pseudomonadales bacterium]